MKRLSDLPPTACRLHGDTVIDTADFHADDKVLHAMAHGLTRVQRFGAQTRHSYTVAGHTWHCMELAMAHDFTAAERLAILIHDFSEGLIGDLPSPWKQRMPGYAEVEAQIMAAVCRQVGLPEDAWRWECVVVVDEEALHIEYGALFAHAAPHHLTGYGHAINASELMQQLRLLRLEAAYGG